MNYLLARLRKVLKEEECFWVFVVILEVYLPPEYFQSITGTNLYIQILQELMKKNDYM